MNRTFGDNDLQELKKPMEAAELSAPPTMGQASLGAPFAKGGTHQYVAYRSRFAFRWIVKPPDFSFGSSCSQRHRHIAGYPRVCGRRMVCASFRLPRLWFEYLLRTWSAVVFLPSSGLPDVHVRLGRVPEQLEDPVATGVFYQATREQLLLNVKHIARYLISAGNEIVVEVTPRADLDMTRLLLMARRSARSSINAEFLPCMAVPSRPVGCSRIRR